MKTVQQYFSEIADKNIRTRALRNMHVERAGDICKSLEHALFTGFLWHRTPEKYLYWSAVHHNIKHPNDLKTVPKIK